MMADRSLPDEFPGTAGNGAKPEVAAVLPLARRTDFTLGAATVRPSVRTIDGPGGSATVEPRVMQVLLALADADGGVLTRDDLTAACWNGSFVGEDALTRAIFELRKAARTTEAGFGVETIPRIGYRLTGATPVNGSAASLHATQTEPDIPAVTTRRWVVVGALAAAAGGVAFWANRRAAPDPAARLIEESRVAMRAGTPVADRQGIALLERAVAISPDNADAWGLLALTRARADEHALDKAKARAAEVDKEAQRSLRLDKDNADAKAALAIAIPYYGDWLAAERRFDAVLAQHPGHIVTRASRTFLLAAVGRMRESARERLTFAGDAPFDADIQYMQIYAFWFLGQIAEADRVAARGMEMWPRHPGFWFARLWVLADTGRFDRALAQIDDPAARPPLPPPMFATLRAAMGAARSRNPAEIDAVVERVMAGVGRSVAAVINAMMLLNLMGATDRAFDLANAYYLEQGPIIAAMQWRPGQPVVPDQRRRKTNPLFTPTAAAMRRDPRFLPLVQQMGLTDYWYRRGILPDFMAHTRA